MIRRILVTTFLMVNLCFTQSIYAELSPSLKPSKIKLTPQEKKLTAWVVKQEKKMFNDLKKIVEINSGTQNIEGLNSMRGIFSERLRKLGFKTQLRPGGSVPKFSCEGGMVKFADHLVATRAGSGARILLSGHLDTVFPKGHAFKTLTREGDILKGPGILDMKGGLIVMLYALENLMANGLLENSHLTVILNTDEEMGSLGSRKLLIDLAKKHEFGVVFEGAYKNKLTRARKGLGQVRLLVKGRSAHAGAAHKQGISAIKELASKVLQVEQLTNYDEKTTVNVGTIKGGEARNTVPPCAEAYIDLRYPKQAQGEMLIKNIQKIAKKSETKNPIVKGQAKTEVWSVLHRPAKEVNPKTDKMLSEVLGISQEFGLKLETRYSGGGTDGSIMQSVGLPTIDSLGLSGSGAHSPREQALYSSILVKTQVASIFLHRLIQKQVLEK